VVFVPGGWHAAALSPEGIGLGSGKGKLIVPVALSGQVVEPLNWQAFATNLGFVVLSNPYTPSAILAEEPHSLVEVAES